MHAVMNWLWQGGVVAVASALLLLALRRTSATARYGVCWGAWLLILALPFLPLLLSTTPSAEALLPAQTEAVVSLPDAWWTSLVLIEVAWLLWAWVQLVRFVLAIIAIRQARARSRAFPAQLEQAMPHWRRVSAAGRRARLVVSKSVASAAVLGWGAPVIAVAPALVKTLSPADLERVLIHEWAHVQRRDDLANILQVVVRIVAGWHPALWWIDRRLSAEREIACDEMAVAITGSPKSYAECLMKLSSVTRTPMAMLTAPVVPASGLRARVVKIVSPYPLIAASWSRALAATCVVALCVISAVVGGRTIVAAATFVAPIVAASIAPFDQPFERPRDLVDEATSVATDQPTARPLRRSQGQPQSQRRQETAPPLYRPLQQTSPALHTAPVVELASAPLLNAPTAVESSAPMAAPEPQPATPVAAMTASVPPAPVPEQDTSAPEGRSPWEAAAAGGVALGQRSQDAGVAIGKGSQGAGVAIGKGSQDAGVAIGRASKDAGVATAGFFSRFARRVAGSF